jgi:hypothetical protein
MSADNQELKAGDTVEVLLPIFERGTTGLLMRACSGDNVVVAIDTTHFKVRINLSRYLVRRAEIKDGNSNNQTCTNCTCEIGARDDIPAGGYSQ